LVDGEGKVVKYLTPAANPNDLRKKVEEMLGIKGPMLKMRENFAKKELLVKFD